MGVRNIKEAEREKTKKKYPPKNEDGGRGQVKVEESKKEGGRVKRLPVLASMIPYISQFVGSLIKPLLRELIHWPQQASNYNQNLIRRFLPKNNQKYPS